MSQPLATAERRTPRAMSDEGEQRGDGDEPGRVGHGSSSAQRVGGVHLDRPPQPIYGDDDRQAYGGLRRRHVMMKIAKIWPVRSGSARGVRTRRT